MGKEAVVFIGNLAKDINISRAGEKRENFGGSSYNTASAATLVKTGDQLIGVSSWVGDDDLGKSIVQALIGRNIDILGIETVKERGTLMFKVTEVTESSRGRIFTEDPKKETRVASVLPEKYRDATYVHLGAVLPQQQLMWLDNFSSMLSPKTKITVDIFESYAREFPSETVAVLKRATGYIFINEEEWEILEMWSKENGEFERLSFSVPIVLKQGKRGASIIYPNGHFLYAPAQEVAYINGTGAGDTLAGVFLTLRAQGVDEKTALERAVHFATQSVTDFGVNHLYQGRY